ncbi:MAG: hypothetical protein IPM07_25515 [Anaerolineales bacterium]|nr:hypothetical protein [Anaerolineales bacterium]
MTEPTTQELIDWLDEYARKQAVFAGDDLGEDPMVASRIKMLRAIVERLRAMQAREAELRYTIEQQKQAMQWRPIEEAPRDGLPILARLGMGGRPVVVHWESPMWTDGHEVYWPNLVEWCRIPPPEGER